MLYTIIDLLEKLFKLNPCLVSFDFGIVAVLLFCGLEMSSVKLKSSNTPKWWLLTVGGTALCATVMGTGIPLAMYDGNIWLFFVGIAVGLLVSTIIWDEQFSQLSESKTQKM